MSWWDSSNFTSLASQAIKSAQKKIDKVLDIPDEAPGKFNKSRQNMCHFDLKSFMLLFMTIMIYDENHNWIHRNLFGCVSEDHWLMKSQVLYTVLSYRSTLPNTSAP